MHFSSSAGLRPHWHWVPIKKSKDLHICTDFIQDISGWNFCKMMCSINFLLKWLTHAWSFSVRHLVCVECVHSAFKWQFRRHSYFHHLNSLILMTWYQLSKSCIYRCGGPACKCPALKALWRRRRRSCAIWLMPSPLWLEFVLLSSQCIYHLVFILDRAMPAFSCVTAGLQGVIRKQKASRDEN